MAGNTNLGKIIPIYIKRFKQDYEELEEDTGHDGKKGSEIAEWLKQEMQAVFSRENIDSPDKERAIKILCQLFTTEDGGDENSRDSPINIKLAEKLYSLKFIDNLKDLLFDNDDISVRYQRFMEENDVTNSITSEFLTYFYPDKYAINNPFSEQALAFLGFEYEEVPDSGNQIGDIYVEYCGKATQILNQLRNDPQFQDADFVTLDDFLCATSWVNIWKVAPGDDANLWDNKFWQENEVVSINWGGVYENLKKDLFSADKETIKRAADGSNYAANQHMKFLYKFEIGDIVVANHGTKAIIGYGIVKSNPKYLKEDGNCYLCRDVLWLKTDLNISIPKGLGIIGKCRHTIASLSFDQYRECVLENTSERKYWVMNPSFCNNETKVITGLCFWNRWIEENRIHLDSWYVFVEKYGEDALAFSDLAEFKKKYKDAYDDNSQPYLLYKYLFSLKKGDIVLINDGKKRIVGKGILSSETYYDYEPQKSYYHDVEWGETDLNIPIPTDLKGIFSRRVVELTKDEYERLMKGMTEEAKMVNMTMLDQLLKRKKQVILYGPPGTGKTYKAKHFIDAHSNSPSDANVHSDMDHGTNTRFVTFHPSFAYEDFIEGLRPETDDDGCIHYRIEDGVFKEFARLSFNVLLQAAGIDKKWEKGRDVPELSNEECSSALEIVSEVPFYLIIDEINRGDISRIFGELITLLEADKRLCEKNCLKTTLPYSKKRFGIPPNLFIIGTMNTADKSISLVDIALRRRFGFLETMPDSDVLRTLLVNDDPEVEEVFDIAIEVLEEINRAILREYDRDHQIGHSYFVKLADEKTPEDACESLRFVWYYEVLPLLQEYFYDSPKKLAKVIGRDFVTLHSDGRSFMFTEPCYNEVFLSALKKLAKMDNSSVEDEDLMEEEDYDSPDD